ncbi:expressed unknown protein [Seminavis robusta]|uniref:Uncharacterized protein n=1 Tax=Seminavis robusta TaxID=568900 RepID=A0A9N8HXS7_9STRA|nr:expressed unknown protein [Seminavis robusta]|eukprot:Sro2296_g322360.1 n/a (106) ;mRNA; f:4564-4881
MEGHKQEIDQIWADLETTRIETEEQLKAFKIKMDELAKISLDEDQTPLQKKVATNTFFENNPEFQPWQGVVAQQHEQQELIVRVFQQQTEQLQEILAALQLREQE